MAFIVDGKWGRVQGRPQAMSLTKTRAMQSVAYPLALKIDPVTLTFDLENQ
jgi:hypothetical protein